MHDSIQNASPPGGVKIRKSAFSPEGYEEPKLTAKLDPRLALGNVHVVAVGLLAGFFWLLNLVPLRGTDLWCHVLYGRWILDHGALPTRDMFCPLLTKTPIVHSAWLSQTILALAERWGGPELLSTLFAVTVAGTFVLLCAAFCRAATREPGQRLGVAVVVTGIVAVVNWSRLFTIRPEMFGYLCFAGLLLLVAGENPRCGADRGVWARRVAVVVLMMFWANLHGSFIVGLAVLGCRFVGRAVERLWETRSAAGLWRDAALRDTFWLGALATLATLVNPHGPWLLAYAFSFAQMDHLRDLLEWRAMAWSGPGAVEFGFSLVLLAVLLTMSRERKSVGHLLALALLAYLSVKSVRMIGWYAGLYGLVLAPHLGYFAMRLLPGGRTEMDEDRPSDRALPGEPLSNGTPPDPPVGSTLDEPPQWDGAVATLPPGRSFYHTLVCLLLIWVAFALSPTSALVFGRPARPPHQLFDAMTPLGAVAYLHQHPVQGVVFTPQWWGDWLIVAGPPGARPLMTTNVHLCPTEAWNEYMTVSLAGPDWRGILARHGAVALLIDRREQSKLLKTALQSGQWRLVYADPQAVVMIADPEE